MKKKIKKILDQQHAGFSGWTHWLIAVCLFFLMWLLPVAWSQQYVRTVSGNALFAFIVFMTVGGASLLPDLDSSPLQEGGSTAVYQLGILGELLSVACIVISGTVWSVCHTKNDKKPPSQHRMLFHTTFMAAVIALLNHMGFPSSSTTCSSLGWRSVPASVWFIMFLVSISIYLGGCMFFYKLFGLLHKQSKTQIACWAIMIFTSFKMWGMPWSQLKLLGDAVALGYLFHVIGDLLTKGSAPIFFPIPTPTRTSKGWKLILWRKPYLFGSDFAITTGGAVNIILNFIMAGVDIILAWMIFFR